MNDNRYSTESINRMHLYRIISEEEWKCTQKDMQVPRCNSDKRDDCVHLTKFEDIALVANKYFARNEKPVVLEVDISDFENKITWIEPTAEKPWHQPNACIENIQWRNIKRYARLIPHVEKENEFMTGSFLNAGLLPGNSES